MEMPTSAIEEWRYSKIDELDLSDYTEVQPRGCDEFDSRLLGAFLDGCPSPLVLVTHNGSVEAHFETTSGIQQELSDPEDIKNDFTSADLFSYLNATFAQPVGLRITEQFKGDRPIVVIHYLDGDNAAIFPNLCISVGRNVNAQVVEVIVSRHQASLLVVPMTKIFQEENSQLDYVLIQDLGSRSQMIGHQVSRLLSESKFNSMSIIAGGSYSRLFTTSTIAGPGADSRLNAAYYGTDDQVLDFRTLQEHSAKNGRSELYFKGAAANNAHLVYSGLIKVDKGATSTDAFQTNKNLVLSEGSRADSVPNLDIQENDVKCSHASAVGPIDQDQKYYLESRGIRPDLVNKLIVRGFFSEMADRTPVEGVEKTLLALVAEKWRDLQE